jgi:hypothetical protein
MKEKLNTLASTDDTMLTLTTTNRIAYFIRFLHGKSKFSLINKHAHLTTDRKKRKLYYAEID